MRPRYPRDLRYTPSKAEVMFENVALVLLALLAIGIFLTLLAEA